MNFNFKSIISALVLAAVFILPVSLNAQSDGFFRGGEGDNSGNRDNAYDFSGIQNNGIGETAPIGSGLLIFAGLGAGYAIMRRKSYKAYKTHMANKSYNSGATLFLAFALLLGMTQCKKNVEQIAQNAGDNVNGTYITLNVGDGSKVNVTPGFYNETTHQTYAKVEYEDGDKIYVVYKTNHVGTLTYEGGQFAGSINAGSTYDNTQLEFYFLGGKGFTVNNNGSAPKIFSVNISDQSEKYPVISYGKSTEPYEGAKKYSSKLENKCSIVKFTVDDAGVDPTGLAITNMNNKVVVDISDGSFTYTKTDDGNGVIKLHKNASQEFWGVLLPQDEVTDAVAVAPGMASLNKITVPEIGENQYISSGVLVTNLKRVFTVAQREEACEQVIFASGNLQKIGENSRFATNQWTVCGNSSDSTDLFQWESTFAGVLNINNVDWKVIGNYFYLITTRKDSNNQPLWGMGCVEYNGVDQGVVGLILFPDNWDKTGSGFTYGNTSIKLKGTVNLMPDGNRFIRSNWKALENAGCVFLPCTGYKNGYGTYSPVSYGGFYWGSSRTGTNADEDPYFLRFNSNGVADNVSTGVKVYYSVRPVRVLNTATVTW